MNPRNFGVLRPRTTRWVARLLTSTLVASMFAIGLPGASLAPAHSVQAGATLVRTSTSVDPVIYERRVQRLVNLRRSNRGLGRLRLAACADNTATRWSHHLASTGDFYHQSMTTVLNRCDARYAGETLGRGTMWPRKLVRMWMKSPAHRKVLLSGKSRRIGVGATTDSYGRWVVAANFVRF
jgi:uncharacterized protein YkwD